MSGMSELGRVRVRVPATIRAGDVIRVRCLIIHPMERVERDAQGRLVERRYRYITSMTATYLGRTVLTLDTTQSVAENPTVVFALRVTGPGPLRVVFADTHGHRYEGGVDLRL